MVLTVRFTHIPCGFSTEETFVINPAALCSFDIEDVELAFWRVKRQISFDVVDWFDGTKQHKWNRRWLFNLHLLNFWWFL